MDGQNFKKLFRWRVWRREYFQDRGRGAHLVHSTVLYDLNYPKVLWMIQILKNSSSEKFHFNPDHWLLRRMVQMMHSTRYTAQFPLLYFKANFTLVLEEQRYQSIFLSLSINIYYSIMDQLKQLSLSFIHSCRIVSIGTVRVWCAGLVNPINDSINAPILYVYNL